MIKSALIAAALAAAISTAPVAYADPSAGDLCYNWRASASDGNGGTLTCKHLDNSGHLMYWEYGPPERNLFAP
jgi:hypothetical protein